MLKLKRPVQQEAEEEHELRLTPDLSFLDVISEACKRNERCTLVARSEGRTFAALVDRAGPFSISGAGLSGIDALSETASLHSGTYTVTEGWTIVQPLYQPGLDTAFRSLTGTGAGDTHALPRARGVDAIRDAIRAAGVDANPFVPATEPGSFPQAPFDAAALAALHPVATATPAPVAFPPAPAALPEAPPTDTQAPAQPALEVEAQGPEPIPPPAPEAAAGPVVVHVPTADLKAQAHEPHNDSALHARASYSVVQPVVREPEAGGQDLVDYLRSAATRAKPPVPEAEVPAPRPRSAVSRLATRFLLWMVYSEGDPDEFTLGQAWGLVGQELTGAVSSVMRRALGGFNQRWQSTRDDWRRSGELAERDRAERLRRARNKEK